MCFSYKQKKEGLVLEKQFKVSKKSGVIIEPVKIVNGFDHPETAIITNTENELLQTGIWGLLPNWAQDKKHQNFTLNARIEDVTTTSSFKDSIQNRCLVLANGFYEWQWLNSKGTNKKKFEIGLKNDETFAFAGIYEFNKSLNNITFSILTTQANDLMSQIHNTKKRMPVILKREDETNWLQGANYNEFSFPYEVDLIANEIEDNQLRLF
ncbi:SOS response-associated peptidase [Flavobacterium urocaniciphilum]|uniref:Abasic site processing protein n=1 Tax=Flavobacterium urocaniciphilum TaxID=1299341 RepID=A0A1H8ZDC6_9FLAO|nr:SOS response associated peptidase (SRAP) [Flavobacterium urocaniciphilum]